MDKPKWSEKQKALIHMLADGMTIDQCASALKDDPYLVEGSVIEEWLRDPGLLKDAIERSNNLIGQAWGTMWQSIKKKAMLGSVQHSKLLIEFVQNDKRLPGNTLQLIFEKAVLGNKDNCPGEGCEDGY